MVREMTAHPVSGKAQLPWESTIDKRVYTDEVVNLVVDAFNKGRELGFQEASSVEKKILAEAFSKNLRRAMEICQQFYSELNSKSKNAPKGMYLKVVNMTEFKATIVMSLNSFYSEERRIVTERMIDIELEHSSSDFKISFMTLAEKENLNLQKLFLDGYIFHYVNHPKKSKA